MARWLSTLGILTLIVLLAHGVVLWTIGQEIAAISSVIDERSDPMFTRTISEQGDSSAPAGKPTSTDTPEAVSESTARTIAAAPTSTVPALKTPTQSAQATPAPPAPKVEPTATASLTPATPTASVSPSLTPTLPAPDATASITPQTSTAATNPEPALTRAPDSTVTASAPAVTSSAATFGTGSAVTGALNAAGIWPGDTRVNYRVGGFFRGELHGSGYVQWTRLNADGAERYQVRVLVDLGLGKLTMTSQGKVTDAGLIPQAFEELNPNGRRRVVTIDDSALTLNNGEKLPRPAGTPPHAVQDAVSQFIDLGHRFMTGKQPLQAGSIVKVWLARPGGMDEWVYDAQEPEMLMLPGFKQPTQAFRLVPRPIPNRRGTITAEFWIAPSLQYLPVKVRIQDGKETELVLSLTQILQR
jgi:hypothetical protein